MTTDPLSLLVLESEDAARMSLMQALEADGHRVRGAASREEANQMAHDDAPQLLVLPGDSADHPVPPPDLVMSSLGTCVLPTAFDPGEREQALQAAAVQGRSRRELRWFRTHGGPASALPRPTLAPSFEELVTVAARSDAPVLLQGETGTGKGYVARLIHDRSVKNDQPFIEVDCSRFSPADLNLELFGCEPNRNPPPGMMAGLGEASARGSLFLDQVDRLDADGQDRLLTLLETRQFGRLGGQLNVVSGARVLVASHAPLSEAVAERHFRAELYYRLQTLTLTLPPLRARPDEILPLARIFLSNGASLSAASEDALLLHRWPGNVRELRDVLWRAQVLAGPGVIDPVHLALPGTAAVARSAAGTSGARPLDTVEREAIRAALAAHRSNRTHAARALGIARSTLLEKIKRYRLP